MSGFGVGEQRWIEGLDKLRNVIRQEVIGRQLADHVSPGMSVLDVGCGQGTQALRLASHGCHVTGVDPSPELLYCFASGASAAGLDAELIEGRIEDLDELLPQRRFDVVCAHGLLLYVPDRRSAIAALASRLAPQGRLSITFRNGHALALRPGLRRDWVGALASFERRDYVNEIGVAATADRLEHVEQDLAAEGMRVVSWYGVRIFNDAIPADTVVPDDGELALLLDAEDLAGRHDPYRWMGSQLHVVAAAR